MAISLQHQLPRSLSWKTKRNLTPVMPAHTFTQSAALVQVCTPVENNSELWRSQTLDVSNSLPKPTASTSSEEKSCQGSWNKLDCFHLTVQRQRKPVKKRKIQQVRKQRLSFVFAACDIYSAVTVLCWVWLRWSWLCSLHPIWYWALHSWLEEHC